jgi:hypothetical protein
MGQLLSHGRVFVEMSGFTEHTRQINMQDIDTKGCHMYIILLSYCYFLRCAWAGPHCVYVLCYNMLLVGVLYQPIVRPFISIRAAWRPE